MRRHVNGNRRGGVPSPPRGDANAGGAFTADAALSANFDSNMLSGTITNFNVGGFEPDWSVALGSSSISIAGAVANAGTTTWTIGGTKGTARNEAAGGGWTAKFYDIPDGAHQPTGVAGGFKAQGQRRLHGRRVRRGTIVV